MDKKAVEIVTLSNQKKFKFSYNYDTNRLMEYIVEARVLYKTVADLPVLPDLATSLQEELIKRSIFGTAAIEGNPLSEKQVMELISGSGNVASTEKAETEIYNLKKTYEYIDEISTDKESKLISEDKIKYIHKLITSGIEYADNYPGKYRHHTVKVGDTSHGGIYTPPKINKDIAMLVSALVNWLNSEEVMKLNPIIRCSLAHYHLALIHPFTDGNGRTARAIEALLLRSANVKYVPLMLSNYYYKNIDNYYWAFSKSIKSENGEVTDFLEFVLQGFVESLNEIKDKITYFIRRFALREAYLQLHNASKVSKRQLDLLNILLSSNKGFATSDLKRTAPFKTIYGKLSDRTVKRDVKHLLDNEFIIGNDNSRFEINLRLLG